MFKLSFLLSLFRPRVSRPCALAAVLVVCSWATALAQTPQITSVPNPVPAGLDYASDILGDQWDFSNQADLSPFPDEFSGWTISATTARTQGRLAFLSGGQFVGRTTTGGSNLVPLLFRGGADFLTSSTESTGNLDHKAIPTGMYGKLAVAMTLSASTAANSQLAAFWYSAPYGGNESGRGVAFRIPQAGTHLYIVDLVSGAWTDARGNTFSNQFLPLGNLPAIPWNGTSLMRGLQLRPTSDGNAQVDVSIDWVRLTQRDGQAGAATLPITFSSCGGREYSVEVAMPGGAFEVIHTGVSGSGATTVANVNHGVLPPGTWSFRVTCYTGGRAGGTAFPSAAVNITINSPPLVTVHNPDATGGADFATAVLGNPWDMNALSDIPLLAGVTAASIVSEAGANALQATATAAGDPAVVLLNGGSLIDTNRYRNVTFALTLDTPFGLNGAVGDGSVARIFWERPGGTGSLVSVTQDIMVWPGRNLYTIDLATLTQPGGLDPDCGCANVPWAGSPVRYFRIDPHESTRNVRFRLGPVTLTAPDEVALGTAFPIQFSFSDADAGPSTYQARIYLDVDRNAGTKTLIDTMSAGVVPNTILTYQLDPSGRGVPAGEYFVFIEIVETRSGFADSRGLYSGGPLRVVAGGGGLLPPGAPNLVGVQTASNPVTVGTAAGASNLAVAPMGAQTSVTAVAPVGVPIFARVVASNAAGSAVSNEISFVVGALTVPGRPTMAAPSISGRTVSLAWAAPTTGGAPTGYILVARFFGNPNIIATFQVNGNAVTVPNVPPGDYVATVAAFNAAGIGPESGGVVVSVR
jgi:hypothetical protein